MDKPLCKLPYTPEDRPTCTPLAIPMGLSVLSGFSAYILMGIDDGLPIIIDDQDDQDE